MRWNELHDLEAEQTVLAGVIRDSDYLPCLNNLQSDDFHNPKNRGIFDAVMKLWKDGSEVDWVTVSGVLNQQQMIYVDDIIQRLASPALAESAAYAVHRIGRVRNLLLSASGILEKADKTTELQEIIGGLSRVIIDNQSEKSDLVRIGTVADEVVTYLDDKYQMRLPKGIATGIDPFDDLLNGLPPECLMILGGRTSTGKTALSLSMASYMADKSPVLFITGEMSPKSLFIRAMANESGLEVKEFLGLMDQLASVKFKGGLTKIKSKQLWFMEAYGATIEDLHGRIMSAFYRIKPAVIFVDYLQQVARAKRGVPAYQSTSEASGFLKQLSGYLKTPIIAMSQVSRMKGDKRQEVITTDAIVRLTLQDLRDSGNIEQDADLVMFIQSPGTRKNDGENTIEIELELAKNRLLGGCARWKYKYHLPTGIFEKGGAEE